MSKPKTYDQNNDQCIIVLKRGKATGLTIGRANTIKSFSRNYFGYGQVSKEWSILPFNHKSGAFSEQGDSGSIIVDGIGRIGGLLTGGSKRQKKESADVTYATPIGTVLDAIHKNEHLTKAYPLAGPRT
jgi:hypothetical protein